VDNSARILQNLGRRGTFPASTSGASTDVAGIAPKYYYLTLGLLAACVIVGFYIALRLQRDVNEDSGPTTEKDLLDPLEKAFYSGLMDEAEFRRIRESVDKRKTGKPAAKPVVPKPKPAPDVTGAPRMGDDPGPIVPVDPGI